MSKQINNTTKISNLNHNRFLKLLFNLIIRVLGKFCIKNKIYKYQIEQKFLRIFSKDYFSEKITLLY